MPDLDAPIGIFDSGVGGLTVARAVIDQLPAERVAVHPALCSGGPQRVLAEPVDVLHLDREVELEGGRAVTAGLCPAGEVGLAERDVTEHLLGEAHG